MADLITRSDVVISDFEEEIQHSFFKIVPCLREHAIWTRGEPGKGKMPLSRVLTVMCSRFHGGVDDDDLADVREDNVPDDLEKGLENLVDEQEDNDEDMDVVENNQES
eukprot:s278_g26.t1